MKSGRKTLMCTARPGWQTISFRKPKYKDTFFNVKVNLVDILELDIKRKVSVIALLVLYRVSQLKPNNGRILIGYLNIRPSLIG
jgi:hypothetical protein